VTVTVAVRVTPSYVVSVAAVPDSIKNAEVGEPPPRSTGSW
jgi:hypothetical protein